MQFEKAVQSLCDGGVDFIIIGGVSATFHGSARVTYDLDICYSRSQMNLRRLTAALAPFHPRPRGFPISVPFVWDEALCTTQRFSRCRRTWVRSTLLAEVTGLGSFDAVRVHSITVEAFGRQVATLDLPGLIRAKRAAGREKDLSALPELECLLEAGESAYLSIGDTPGER